MQVKVSDTSSNERQARLYIINGTLFNESDSIKIDSALNSYSLQYLVDIDFVTCQQMNFPHCFNDIILITIAYDQKGKVKRQLLRKVNSRFVDNYVSFSQHIFTDGKDPVLYINNELIHHSEAKERIQALTSKNVYYIHYNDKPVSPEYYGQNAKNGLVRIWTISKKIGQPRNGNDSK